MAAVADVVGTGERRQFARHAPAGTDVPAVLWARAHTDRRSVRNLSRDGLALVLDEPVEPGTTLRVALLNRAGNFWHLKLVRVVHAAPAGAAWLIGGTFLTRLSDREVQDLLHHYQPRRPEAPAPSIPPPPGQRPLEMMPEP